MASQSTAETAEFVPLDLQDGLAPPSPFSSLVKVDVAALSHPGKVRTNNEDHFLVTRLGRYLEVISTNLPDGEVPGRAEEVGYGFVVADGIGGAEGGEIASRLAIQTLINLVLTTPDWNFRPDNASAKEILSRTTERYRIVNAALGLRAGQDAKLAKMGTTMTLAYSIGMDLFLGHVGDSRAYLWRLHRLWQLTRDHTLVQAMVDLGELTPAEAATHPRRHVLIGALGRHDDDFPVDALRLELADGDWLLLCSDGLSDLATSQQIADVLKRSNAAHDACQALVDLALDLGGRDNITVIVARYMFPKDVA